MPNPRAAEKSDLEILLDNGALRKAAAWFAANKAWILEQQLAVCRIPAPTFLEQPRAEHIRAELAAFGYEAVIDNVGNVMASLPGNGKATALSGKGPVVVLSAHMDTVLSPRRPEDIRVEGDGTLRGPGVADNGAGLSALFALAKVFADLPAARQWPFPLVLVANVGEEGEGNLTGMRYLCKDSSLAGRIAAALVVDGPGHEHVTCHALASRRYEVSFQGKGGHSWSDFGTVNPVHALSRAVALFADSNSVARSKLVDRYSLNVGMIQGGSSINSIPQSASAKVDIRSEREGLIEELASSLTRCVEQALFQEHEQSRKGKLSAKVREIGSRPGGDLPEDSPLLTVLAAIDRELGIASQPDTSSTDANIPLSMGIPAVAIGAGGSGGGAHTTEEWYRPEGRDLGLRRAFLLTCAALAGIALPAEQNHGLRR